LIPIVKVTTLSMATPGMLHVKTGEVDARLVPCGVPLAHPLHERDDFLVLQVQKCMPRTSDIGSPSPVCTYRSTAERLGQGRPRSRSA
jgi:hypothetical protein